MTDELPRNYLMNHLPGPPPSAAGRASVVGVRMSQVAGKSCSPLAQAQGSLHSPLHSAKVLQTFYSKPRASALSHDSLVACRGSPFGPGRRSGLGGWSGVSRNPMATAVPVRGGVGRGQTGGNGGRTEPACGGELDWQRTAPASRPRKSSLSHAGGGGFRLRSSTCSVCQPTDVTCNATAITVSPTAAATAIRKPRWMLVLRA